jgi:uncharacterized protein (TIGR02453 family)
MPAFTGFTPKTLAYLAGLEDNNTREWFAAHKDDYQTHLLAPFVALAASLGPALLAIDPAIEVTPAVGKALSRMNRDVRFSRDKSPYRARMWMGFKRPLKDWSERPAFYFELTPQTHRFGMGFYSAAKSTMDRLRTMIAAYPDAFRKQVAFLSGQSLLSVEGERYKRTRSPDLPDDLQAWNQWKSFHLVCNRDNDERLFSPELAGTMRDAFNQAAPFYRFLRDLGDDPE